MTDNKINNIKKFNLSPIKGGRRFQSYEKAKNILNVVELKYRYKQMKKNRIYQHLLEIAKNKKQTKIHNNAFFQLEESSDSSEEEYIKKENLLDELRYKGPSWHLDLDIKFGKKMINYIQRNKMYDKKYQDNLNDINSIRIKENKYDSYIERYNKKMKKKEKKIQQDNGNSSERNFEEFIYGVENNFNYVDNTSKLKKILINTTKNLEKKQNQRIKYSHLLYKNNNFKNFYKKKYKEKLHNTIINLSPNTTLSSDDFKSSPKKRIKTIRKNNITKSSLSNNSYLENSSNIHNLNRNSIKIIKNIANQSEDDFMSKNSEKESKLSVETNRKIKLFKYDNRVLLPNLSCILPDNNKECIKNNISNNKECIKNSISNNNNILRKRSLSLMNDLNINKQKTYLLNNSSTNNKIHLPNIVNYKNYKDKNNWKKYDNKNKSKLINYNDSKFTKLLKHKNKQFMKFFESSIIKEEKKNVKYVSDALKEMKASLNKVINNTANDLLKKFNKIVYPNEI